MQEHFWKAIIGGGVAGLSLVTNLIAQAVDHAPPSLSTVTNLTLNAACIYAVIHMFRMLMVEKKAAADDRVSHANERKQDAVNHAIERNAAASEHSKAMSDLQSATITMLREDAQRAEASRSALQTTIEGLRADLKK